MSHTQTAPANSILPMIPVGGRHASEIDADIEAALTSKWLRPLQIEAEVSISVGEGTFNEMWGAIATHMQRKVKDALMDRKRAVLSAPLAEADLELDGLRGEREVLIVEVPERIELEELSAFLAEYKLEPCGVLELLAYVQHLIDTKKMTEKEMLAGKDGTNEAHPLRKPLLAAGTRLGTGHVPAANVKGRRLFLDGISTELGLETGTRLLVTRV